ncbi:MAG: biotin--[acetyl-CoA-carboxylase] ligase [Treponema sp.]|nr:biotin--[acetyl-CoA-carboxylase] ligase [Treponema sp.]
MKVLRIRNQFNAPVYHEETVTSTMDVSRQLAENNEPHGTVITADFQEAGRGRIHGRLWRMERAQNLSFTVLLRYPRIESIPRALTLRAGLALSLAIEDFAPLLKRKVFVKWPNDIIIGGKKAAGILCEADGGNVHLGIGVNVMQKEFPGNLKERATSIFLEAWNEESGDRSFLLEKILFYIFNELENSNTDWKVRLEDRLFKKGEKIVFIDGAADSGREINGKLAGITEAGELLIIPDGETHSLSFITGELKLSV